MSHWRDITVPNVEVVREGLNRDLMTVLTDISFAVALDIVDSARAPKVVWWATSKTTKDQ